MTTVLIEDDGDGYSLVKKNGEVIANYPINKLEELRSDFKKICLTSEFDEYNSLDDFLYNIYFLKFLEYYLDNCHKFMPEVFPYEKDKSKLTGDELLLTESPDFNYLIKSCNEYLFSSIDIESVLNKLNRRYDEIFDSTYSDKKKSELLCLYNGFIYFLNLSINNQKLNHIMNLLIYIKNSVEVDNKTKKIFFSNTKINFMTNSFTKQNMLEYRKYFLSKFRLFQRKYVSAVAKLRKIGPSNASNKKSKEIKKELNKTKNVDYKAYEIYCLYVLSKEGNETIYDYLAGIHTNIIKDVIHKNINNNTVANIKANTKKRHHEEYLERSEAILKMVEAKIKEYGDIIDIKTKNQVVRIRKLFDSKQFKNLSLSFGNENSPSIGGKIIQDCKRIRAINKEIDKMIKEHMKQENKDKQQKKEKKY